MQTALAVVVKSRLATKQARFDAGSRPARDCWPFRYRDNQTDSFHRSANEANGSRHGLATDRTAASLVRASRPMTFADIILGLLAGLVSCLTPEAFLLFPLTIAAAGAERRSAITAIAVGLGLSLVVIGAAALEIEQVWLRRIVCAVLLLQGIALMSVSTVERFSFLTGGLEGSFELPGGASVRSAFRLVLLAILIGGNWLPLVGPTLGKASLMAADQRNSGLAFGTLFVFGIGAAIPWIVLGRLIRILVRPLTGRVPGGMGGKRILGASLMIVALLGGSGLDIAMVNFLDPLLPPWTKKLAITF
jgi:cytochrome c-type biogenesis protein